MFEKENILHEVRSVSSLTELNKYLLLGAERGDLNLVKYCLKSGADPSAMVRFGRNALHIAAERGDLRLGNKIKFVQSFHSNVPLDNIGRNMKTKRIICAGLVGEVLVTAAGIDINKGTYHTYTPLHLACNSHKHEFLEFLLAQGAHVDVPDKLGRTALHYAVGNRDERMTSSCLKYGADVNARDSMESTPLSLAAVDTCSLPLVKLLLHHKANPNLTRRLCIPIFLDCILNINSNLDSSDSYKILSLLLKYGVNPNVVDTASKKNGMHYAAISGNVELSVFLVQHGTDPFAKDSLGRTSLDIARQFNHYQLDLWLKHLVHKRDYVSETSFSSHDMYF